MAHTDKHPQSAPVISKFNWFWTLLALSIPVVGLAFCLYWFFNKDTNPSKRNFATAALLWGIISIVFYLFVFFWSSWIINDIYMNMDSFESGTVTQPHHQQHDQNNNQDEGTPL